MARLSDNHGIWEARPTIEEAWREMKVSLANFGYETNLPAHLYEHVNEVS